MGAAAGAAVPFVRFATTGATFTPVVELAGGSGASVSWWCEETDETLTGLTPSFAFDGAATRHVQLTAAGGGGLADIRTVNLGYLHTDDAGRYSLSDAYDKAAEAVSGIEYVNELTGLVRFLAANGNLAGSLDFTGCADLEHVECFSADVEAVTLTGCTSLIRLCVENCDMSTIDLNPVAGSLYEFRAAAQQGGALALTALTSDMAHVYHFCVVNQTVTGMPSATRLQVVEEWWFWNTVQSGALTAAVSGMTNLAAYTNGYTSADVSGSFVGGSWKTLDLHSCALTSVTLTGCTGLTSIYLAGNSLAEAAVDAVLAEVESWDTTGSWTLDLSDSAVPSTAGFADVALLEGRGWTVTVEIAWADYFARADCTGLVNVGNGWTAWNGGDGDLSGGDLVRTDAGDYRMVLNPTSVPLPADYSVTVIVPHNILGTYFGAVGRWLADHGVKVFWYSGSTTSHHVGDASSFSGGDVTCHTDAGYPASWSVDQDHTITMTFTGTTVSVYLDGQGTRAFYATITVNATETGTGVGMCGEGNGLHWRSIAVTVP
jgi:hypothetical protein